MIKSSLKKCLNRILYKYRSLVLGRIWKKRFLKTKQFEVKLSKIEKKEYLSKWKDLTKSKINFSTVSQVKGLTGKFDVNIVPEEVFALDIEPNLNSDSEIPFFENKSACEKWFGNNYFPTTYMHNINGIFYDCDYNRIQDVSQHLETSLKYPLIAKPNKDTYGGKGVEKINTVQDLTKFLATYSKNYVLQEFIKPCSFLNQLTGNRPVSLRVSAYNSVLDNKVHILNVTLRLGWGNSLDNASTGGIYLNINTNGCFSTYALNTLYEKFYFHPDTKVEFEGLVLPECEKLISETKELAGKIPFARLTSFDMVLDSNKKWRVYEVNILGQTIRFSQNFAIPFFGEFTGEIITDVKNKIGF